MSQRRFITNILKSTNFSLALPSSSLAASPILLSAMTHPPPATTSQARMAGNHVFPGFEYNRVNEKLIVGSCPVKSDDVQTLKNEGVDVIISVQLDSDRETLDVDIDGVKAKSKELGVAHVHQPTPKVTPDTLIHAVSLLARQAAPNGIPEKTVYSHCAAGYGRGPVIAVGYLFWFGGYGLSLNEAWDLVNSCRKISADRTVILEATAKLLGGDAGSLTADDKLTEEQFKAIRERVLNADPAA